MSKTIDDELSALLNSRDRTKGRATRISELIQQGATLNPATGIPPLFVAIHGLDVPSVRALLAAGASLDARLPTDWTDLDDEGEFVICRAGISARNFFASFEKEERKGTLTPQRAKWLGDVAALMVPKSAKPATKAGAKNGAKAGTKAAVNDEATLTLEGRWVEIRRTRGSRSEAVREGAALVIKDAGFSVKGSLAVGIPKKGKLEKHSEQAATYRDTDLCWSFVVSAGQLTITSPAEADDEHGLVYTATFTRAAK